ncbi:MAG: PDR/VanB family oxidoreductase [Janthinobacterium lividum]
MDNKRLDVRVQAITDESAGIRSFKVVRTDGRAFEPYEPGAHVDVTVPGAPTRQYSLCGDPRDSASYQFAVKREAQSRGGSRALHDAVHVGTVLTLSLPRTLFGLSDHAKHHQLYAGGIGITPLLSMGYRLLEQGAPFRLHYFVRSVQDAAFVSLLQAEPFARHVTLHVGVGRERLDESLAASLRDLPPDAHVYTCGPGPFMDRVVAAAAQVIDPEHIHLERFAADPAMAPAQNAAQDSFEVRLAASGRTAIVPPGESIVEALAKLGIEIDTSCGEGICGTCMVDVLEGAPDHRDHCLSKAERASGKVICCCVSRSHSPLLVLDL